MARNSSGPKNQPRYDASGAPSDAADLTEVSEFAALVGNRKTGTANDRTALAGADRWVGLEFYETDTQLTWTYLSSGWVLLRPASRYEGGAGGNIGGGSAAADLANGFITKAGQVVSGTSVSFGNEYFPGVTFATPFPTRCLGVQLTQFSGSGITKSSGALIIDSLSASAFRALVPESGTAYVRGYMWFAYGV